LDEKQAIGCNAEKRGEEERRGEKRGRAGHELRQTY
jgi:hypothetical protein